MKKQLTERFFARPSKDVAESLIGTTIFVDGKRGKKTAVILGTKAFEGGEILKRREGMNYPPATIFLMSFRGHTFLNFATERGNKPSCVMIDKILLKDGEQEIVIEGPGRVSTQLGIKKGWDGLLLGNEIHIEPATKKSVLPKRTEKHAENCTASFKV